jgi:hypothetical protein
MSKKKEKETAPKKKVSKTAKADIASVMDFEGITDDGIICKTDGTYSKLYELIDSNFSAENEDKQEESLLNFNKLTNRFPENTDISIVVVNKRNTKEELSKNYHLKETGNEKTDKYVNAYNDIIDTKISEGNNEIQKIKYLLLTVHTKTLSDAQGAFNSIDVSLKEALMPINKYGYKNVDAISRLTIMRDILRGSEPIDFKKENEQYLEKRVEDDDTVSYHLNQKALKARGKSIKSMICPQTITRHGNYLELADNRLCKSFVYADLPQSLDTSFLTGTTNLPYEMVTVLQLKVTPRKKAIRNVKMMTTSIKAEVLKANKNAWKNGYDPSVAIDEDLAKAQEDSKRLRNDVVVEGKRLFYATMVVTVFAENEEDLKDIQSQFTSKCADFSMTPNFLIGQQLAALNTAMLLGNSSVIIDRQITSDDVCALQPFNIQEIADKKGHFYGINAISKNMIMYDRKRSKLANGMIFGQSGSGKSMITKGEITANLMDGDDRMIILDPENEYREIANAYDGIVIDLELKADYHINPCDMSMEWSNPKATPLEEKCDYMVGLVESILGKNKECNMFEVNVIHRATQRMYQNYINVMHELHDNGDTRDIDPASCPTLVDFYKELKNDGSMEGNKIAQAVEQYCVGSYNVFAHHTNVNTDKRLIVYNLLYLPEKMREMAMKVCLSNIWTRIVENGAENKRLKRNRSIWVYLDEFHTFFRTESSSSTILAYYKRVRKYGGIMTGITQDANDLLSTRQGAGMFSNSGFFLFLNQSPLGRQQIQQLYDVSDTLIDYIKDKPSGIGLMYNGFCMVPFNYRLPTDNDLYLLMSTNPNDEKKLARTPKKEEKADSEEDDE